MAYQLYTYSCPVHGEFSCATRADNTTCHISMSCTQPCQRRWGFSIASSFQPHYNPTVGLNVSTPGQFQSELSRASERASAPTTNYLADGTPIEVQRAPHNFQPVDLHDKQTLGVTNDGLDATYDAWRKQGRDDDAKKLKKLMDE